jgi:hypothetical protein
MEECLKLAKEEVIDEFLISWWYFWGGGEDWGDWERGCTIEYMIFIV